MPTYQYACTECGAAHEEQQSFTDAPLTTCPRCGGRLRKVFSAVGVVFKGSGFYRNDSRKESTGEKADSAAAKAESGAKADASTGSKADGSGTGASTGANGTDAGSGKKAEKGSGTAGDKSTGSKSPSGSAA